MEFVDCSTLLRITAGLQSPSPPSYLNTLDTPKKITSTKTDLKNKCGHSNKDIEKHQEESSSSISTCAASFLKEEQSMQKYSGQKLTGIKNQREIPEEINESLFENSLLDEENSDNEDEDKSINSQAKIKEAKWEDLFPISQFISKPNFSKCFQVTQEIKDVDAYSSKAPSSVTNSITKLGKYLESKFKKPLLKVRSICHWVASNITYDQVAFDSKEYGDQSAEAVLQKRMGVCAGYSNLVKALCQIAKVECEKISGWSKGAGYQIGQSFQFLETDHAWNAVKLNGKWLIIDSTWMAPKKDKDPEAEVNSFYFLTPPEMFIFDHFPEDNNWQLLDQKWTLEEFGNSMKSYSYLFQHQIWPENNYFRCVIKAKKRVCIHIECNRNLIDVTADLKIEQEKIPNVTNCSYLPNGFKIEAILPQQKKYTLDIFSKEKRNQGKLYSCCLSYLIDCTEGEGTEVLFPSFANLWKNSNFILHYPENGFVKATNGKARIVIGNKYHYILSAHLKLNDVEIPNSIYIFKKKGNYHIKVKVPKKGLYDLEIFGIKENDYYSNAQFPQLISFKIYSEEDFTEDFNYPKFYSEYQLQQNMIQSKDFNFGTIHSQEGKVQLEFLIHKDFDIIISLKDSNQNKLENQIQITRNEQEQLATVQALLPKAENYELILFGKHKSNKENTYPCLASFCIINEKGLDQCFPMTYKCFDSHKQLFKMLFPEFGKVHSENGKVTFKIEKLGQINIQASLIFGDTELEQNIWHRQIDNILEIDFLLPHPGEYFVFINIITYKKLSNNFSSSSLSRFSIIEKKGCGNEIWFPKFSLTYMDFCDALQIISPLNGRIVSNSGSCEIKLKVNPNIEILPRLRKKDSDANIENQIKEISEGQCTIIKCLLSEKGFYNLLIYAKERNDNGSYTQLFTYTILEKKGGVLESFPIEFASLKKYPGILIISPLCGTIHSSDGLAHVRLAVNNDSQLLAELLLNSNELKNKAFVKRIDETTQEVNAIVNQSEKYELKIYAKTSVQQQYLPIYKYFIHGKENSDLDYEYPKTFRNFSQIIGLGFTTPGKIDSDKGFIDIILESNKALPIYPVLKLKDKKIENCCFYMRKKEQIIYKILLPEIGQYCFTLYHKENSTAICEYKIMESKGVGDLRFANINLNSKAMLMSPILSKLCRGQTYKFKIMSRIALDAKVVISSSEIISLQKIKSFWIANIRIPENPEENSVILKIKTRSQNFTTFASWLIE